ncbi:Hsp70 family protein [Kitasatospora purpeofusca]|uniref:Hsp70 family protein n=1 Tax=Kitasatospora purpeofusca TaxID=67352 RepID=UPI0035D67FDC
MTAPRYSVGLDLGDGESVIAWADCRDRSGVRLFEPTPGRVGVDTVLARGPMGERLLGEAALRQPEPREVRITFKQRPVQLKAGLVPPSDAAEFAALLLSAFAERHPDIADADNCLIHIGHPAGWDQEVVDIYRLQLESALRPLPVVLVPESQSAFLHVLDEERSALAKDRTSRAAARPALVVDIGSSTTDFTLVATTARNLPFGDSLGGRLIDAAIADHVTAEVDDPAARERLTRPTPRGLLLWLARRAKEAHFNSAGADPVEAFANSELRWVLDTCGPLLGRFPVGELVAGTGGWEDLLRAELERVRAHLGAQQPAVVLTAGGGSRMPFVSALCQQVFPAAVVDPVEDPSLTVARGLASYGRWQARVRSFHAGVEALASRERIDPVVAEHTPRIKRFLGEFLVRRLGDAVYEPILAEIEAGGDPVVLLNADAFYQRFLDWFESPAGLLEREEFMGPLERDLDRALQPEANRICRENALDEGSLNTRVALPISTLIRPEGFLRSIAEGAARMTRIVARSNSGRAWIRTSYRLHQWAGRSVPSHGKLLVVPASAFADMSTGIAEEVRAKLLARSLEVERLLI